MWFLLLLRVDSLRRESDEECRPGGFARGLRTSRAARELRNRKRGYFISVRAHTRDDVTRQSTAHSHTGEMWPNRKIEKAISISRGGTEELY